MGIVNMSWQALGELCEKKFPLCEVEVRENPDERMFTISVRDSGGLTAAERIPYADLLSHEQLHTVKVITRAFNKLADVFETPSHWMAL